MSDRKMYRERLMDHLTDELQWASMHDLEEYVEALKRWIVELTELCEAQKP